MTSRPAARRRRALPAALIAPVSALLAGCAALAPSIPLGSPPPTHGAHGPAQPAAAASPAAPQQSATPPAVQVAAAAQADAAQLGVQIYWHTTGSPARVTAAADQVLDYVVGLGANSVGLTFPVYTDGVRPTKVYGVAGSTPDPGSLRLVIDEAEARGLRVMLRPVIDEADITDARGDWRGSIQPRSMNAWFASYQQFLAPYLALAQETHVGYFVVGTELESLAAAKTQWAALETAAARLYTGELDYAQNWDDWANGVSTPQAQNVGVDAYPELHVSATASVAQLTAAWKSWLRKRSGTTLAHTVVQEVGIPAVGGAYAAPAQWAKPGDRINARIQQNWFAAACQSARALGLPGMYFWDVDSYADPAAASAYDSGSFIGRGDQAIKSCFAGWGS